jgi:hypothetical protein
VRQLTAPVSEATKPPIKPGSAEPADPRRSQPDREDPEREQPERVERERVSTEPVGPTPSESSGGPSDEPTEAPVVG